MKKVHRFIGNFDLALEVITISDVELVNQIHNVLKLKSHEVISLCDGSGNDATATIESIGKNEIIVRVSERAINIAESTREVSIFVAILKSDNFDFVVQKATEVGVSRIIPIITERTVKQNINKSRLERIAREASELSGRGRVPEIGESMQFDEAIGYALMSSNMACFFDMSGISANFDSIKESKISLFVGPEGGWSDREREMASEAGLYFMSLGARMLRGETASIIASYLACK